MRSILSVIFIATVSIVLGCESSGPGIGIDTDPSTSGYHGDSSDVDSQDTTIDSSEPADETDNVDDTESASQQAGSDSGVDTDPVDTLPEDADGDGWAAGHDLDCDDNDSSVYPGAEEIQNGIDDDCDGVIDEVESTDEPTCEETGFAIDMTPSRLMILQDLSGSMDDMLGGGWSGGDTKWEIARKALKNTLSNPKNAAIEFGFDYFPMKNNCGTGSSVRLDAAPNQAAKISNMLNNLYPNGATPLCLAMSNFDPDRHPGYASQFNAKGADKFLLVVSDGADTCGGSGCSSSSSSYSNATYLAARTADLLDADIKTFVIGFGEGCDKAQLNAIAKAGGTGYNTFFNAQDPQSLQDALDNVAKAVVSCEYTVNSSDAAADPEKVNFYFDGDAVPYNPGCAGGIGWDWVGPTHKSVVFCKNSCDLLKSGDVESVTASFGCKSQTN